MVFRYRTESLDDILIIKDTVTGNSIKISRCEADSILNRLEDGIIDGVLPYATYFFNGVDIVIKHFDSSDSHCLNINVNDLKVIVRNDIGVVNMGRTISYGIM